MQPIQQAAPEQPEQPEAQEAMEAMSVHIQKQPDGTFMVGLMSDAGDGSNMQPAGNIDEALSLAKNMLVGPSQEQAQQNQSEFEGGYQSVTGPAAA